MQFFKKIVCFIFLFFPVILLAQDIELFSQFNGSYNYIAFGNTLNEEENGGNSDCNILTQSSANFQLDANQTIEAAYLYWAGSGTGDFEVQLNNLSLTAQRTFQHTYTTSDGVNYEFFSAFTDVTDFLSATGNGSYTFSELDLFAVIPAYCGRGLNFGGWSIVVIYEDPSLPLNQLNVFDGLQAVSRTSTSLSFTIDNLNVVDNTGATIGFLSWEGDVGNSSNETLRINGNLISDPPLNPADNVFNGTNSFTGSSTLYNMDIDVYNIQDNIATGDTSALIELTSNQDFVMVNNIVTVLNTELPDATITLDAIEGGTVCGDRNLEVSYTVSNLNSTGTLPPATPIAFYANNTLVGQAQTQNILPIDATESGTITVTIPPNIPPEFTFRAVVDDTGTGAGIVTEILEDNNEAETDIRLLILPEVLGIRDLETCNVIGPEFFDLTEATSQIDPVNTITFFTSEVQAQTNTNPIETPEAYSNISNPQIIYVRVSNPDCFVITSFTIEVIECPLPDATVTIATGLSACRQRNFLLPYTIYNTLATGPLPQGTQVHFYMEGILVEQTQTSTTIPVGGSEQGSITMVLPDTLPDIFEVRAVVDINNLVEELEENNNQFFTTVTFTSLPPIQPLPDLLACDEGFEMALFDLTQQEELISTDPEAVITYFTTIEDAMANTNPISDPGAYQNEIPGQVIYIRLENEICFTTSSFLLTIERCPLFIPEGFSPNGDGINDTFEISNLLNVFEDFQLQIFSREGNLIYKGYNEDLFWNGISNHGLLFRGNLVPVGTYYYVLHLNDPQYKKPLYGFVYVNY